MSAEQPGLIAPEDESGELSNGPGGAAGPARSVAAAPTVGKHGKTGKAAAEGVERAAGTDGDEPRPPGPKKLTRRERRQLGRLRARKVKRVIRRVDPWSVLLLSLGFYLCLFVVLMVSGVLLWVIASNTGTIHQIEGVIKESFAEKSFTFDGVKLFRASFLGGLVLVIAGSGLNVLLCTLFNLISDLVGGIRVTVIEEESAKPAR